MPGKNYHNAQTVNYVCPFFQSETELFIRCEGLVPDTVNSTRFYRKKAMEDFRSAYCFSFGYGACHWAKLLYEEKYPETRRAK